MASSASASTGPTLALVCSARLSELDDAGLAQAAIEGHAGAHAAVWQRYAGLVTGLLRRTLGPGADVEDQVQETFVQLFRDVKKLREPAALRSFVVGVTIRVARSELRRRRFRRWLTLTDSGTVPDDEPAAGDDAEAREAVRRLYALLDRLDDRARMLFVLRYVEDLELTEVAAALGMSLATTKRHLAKVTAQVHAMAAGDPLLAPYLAPAAPALSRDGAASRPKPRAPAEPSHDGAAAKPRAPAEPSHDGAPAGPAGDLVREALDA
ncbi:RNA polymerase sigma factor RpoE [Minicystis rosea]|nr:RNA polymerase sigma factor RpoE [Minicystis rosea]